MFYIDKLKKQMEESKDQWKEIDGLVKKLEESYDLVGNNDLKKLVLLLVKQIKPAYSPDTFENSMKEILDVFTGGKKDEK